MECRIAMQVRIRYKLNQIHCVTIRDILIYYGSGYTLTGISCFRLIPIIKRNSFTYYTHSAIIV